MLRFLQEVKNIHGHDNTKHPTLDNWQNQKTACKSRRRKEAGSAQCCQKYDGNSNTQINIDCCRYRSANRETQKRTKKTEDCSRQFQYAGE